MGNHAAAHQAEPCEADSFEDMSTTSTAGAGDALSVKQGPSLARAETCAEVDSNTCEFVLVRGPGEAWGFAWHVGAHADKRLVVAGIDPASPAGRWSAEQKQQGKPGIQRGDELLSVNGALQHHAMRHELVAAEAAVLLFRRVSRAPSSSLAVSSAPPVQQALAQPLDSNRSCQEASRLAVAASGPAAERQKQATAEAWRAVTEAALKPPSAGEPGRCQPMRLRVKNTFLHVDCDVAPSRGSKTSPRHSSKGLATTKRLSLSDPLAGTRPSTSEEAVNAWKDKGSLKACVPRICPDSPSSSLSSWRTARSRSCSGSRSLCSGGDEASQESMSSGRRSASPPHGNPQAAIREVTEWQRQADAGGRTKSPMSLGGQAFAECHSDAQQNMSDGAHSSCPSTDWDYPVSSYVTYMPQLVPMFPGAVWVPSGLPFQAVPAAFPGPWCVDPGTSVDSCSELFGQDSDRDLDPGHMSNRSEVMPLKAKTHRKVPAKTSGAEDVPALSQKLARPGQRVWRAGGSLPPKAVDTAASKLGGRIVMEDVQSFISDSDEDCSQDGKHRPQLGPMCKGPFHDVSLAGSKTEKVVASSGAEDAPAPQYKPTRRAGRRVQRRRQKQNQRASDTPNVDGRSAASDMGIEGTKRREARAAMQSECPIVA